MLSAVFFLRKMGRETAGDIRTNYKQQVEVVKCGIIIPHFLYVHNKNTKYVLIPSFF